MERSDGAGVVSERWSAAVAASVKARRERAPALFWARVNKTDQCWTWTGAHFWSGYARVKYCGRDTVAHRVAYELAVGPIPKGLEIDHLCRNRGCVRPDHLEPVTHSVNERRGDTVIARNAAKTHCVRGHALSGVNVLIRRNGNRRCQACERAYQKRLRSRPESRAQHAENERRRRAVRRSAT